MRNLKRALSLALASVMLLGMMVVGAGAASYPDVDDEKNVEAISVLQAVGAMKGDENGNFNPDKKVTRNEMAAVVARLLLGEAAESEDYSSTHPFTDVPEWADKYVSACYERGIVNGTSATTYSGDNTVTAQEAAAMMLRALGYEKLQGEGANWAAPIVAKARELDLFKGVGSNGSATAELDRNQVAQLALNTLKADVVTTSVTGGTTGTITAGDATVILTGEIKYNKVSISGVNYNKAESGTDDYKYQQLCEKLYEGKLELIPAGDTSDEPADDLGRPASIWKYDGDDVFTATKKADFTVTLEKTPGTQAKLLELYKKNLSLDGSIFVNGADKDSEGEAYTYSALGAGDVVEFYMDKDDSKKVENIYVTRYVLAQITDVDDDVKDDDAEDGVSCYVTFKDGGALDDEAFNDTDIPGFDAKTYVEDAYVALLYVVEEGEDDAADTYTIIDSYIPEVVEDSIDTNKEDTEFAIGKDKYTVAAGYDDSAAKETVSPGTDNTYALYLDKNGYVLGIEEVEGEAAGIDDVYYLDTVWKETGKMNSESYYAQLVALDGTKKEVELEAEDHVLPTIDPTDDEADESDGDETPAATISLAVENFDFSSLTGMLVTISDQRVKAGETVTSKKGNDKYNLKLWNPEKDWEYGTVVAQDGINTNEGENNTEEGDTPVTTIALKLGKSDRNLKVTVSEKQELQTYRLNGSTVYLFAEGTGKDLAVTRYVGGVSYDKSADYAFVIVEEGKTLAKYVVIAAADAELEPDFTEDVIFIQKASKAVGDGYRSQEVYLPDGTKETWKIKDDAYGNDDTLADGPGFYQYSEGDKGIYAVDKVDPKIDSDLDWQDDKKEGVLDAVTFTDANALFEGMLTVTVSGANDATYTIDDITVDGASFKDLHDTDTGYGKTVKSLQALADLMKGDDPKATSATLYMNISKDGAVSIFVTDVAAPGAPTPPPNEGEEGGDEEGGEGTKASLEVTIAYTESDNSTAINVSTLADGDKVAITSSGATTNLDLEFTKGTGGWELSNGKTAPEGWEATFDGSKLTLTASDVGSGKTDTFGTISATPTIAAKAGATASVTKGTLQDGTDATTD